MSIDFAKVSKAIAGGVAAATGGSATAYVMIPAGVNAPAWLMAAIPLANFVIGFAIVYWAPANKTTPQQ